MSLVPAALVSPMGIGKEEDPLTPPGIRNCSWEAKRRGSFHLFVLLQEEKLFPSGHLLGRLALTQWEGAAQSRLLQRVADLPT